MFLREEKPRGFLVVSLSLTKGQTGMTEFRSFLVKSKVGSEQEGGMLIPEDQVQLTSTECKDNQKSH